MIEIVKKKIPVWCIFYTSLPVTSIYILRHVIFSSQSNLFFLNRRHLKENTDHKKLRHHIQISPGNFLHRESLGFVGVVPSHDDVLFKHLKQTRSTPIGHDCPSLERLWFKNPMKAS